MIAPPRRPGRFLRQITWAENDCWLWSGYCEPVKGYGRYASKPAHRVGYVLFVGPIPDGLELDHLCEVKACVNPTHLEPVTTLVNIRRARRGVVLTPDRCQYGHLLTEENATRQPRAQQLVCRTCRRENCRRSRAVNRAERKAREAMCGAQQLCDWLSTAGAR